MQQLADILDAQGFYPTGGAIWNAINVSGNLDSANHMHPCVAPEPFPKRDVYMVLQGWMTDLLSSLISVDA